MLALLLDRATLAPPARAAALSVTLHAAVPGAVTLEGAQVSPVNVGAIGCEIFMTLFADDEQHLPTTVTTTPMT